MTAVAPVVVECKGTWIGWSGSFDLKPGDPIPESDPEDRAPTAGLKSSQVNTHFLIRIHMYPMCIGCLTEIQKFHK